MIPLLALLVLTAVSLEIALRLVNAGETVERGQAILADLERAQTQVEAAGAAHRGLVATGKGSFLPGYASAAAALPKTLALLRDRVAEPRQHALLQQLEQEIAALLQTTREDIELRRERDFGADADRIRLNHAQMLVDRCRAMMLDMNATERQSLADLRLRSDQELRDLSSMLWGAMAGVVLLLSLALLRCLRPAGEGAADRGRRELDTRINNAAAKPGPLGDLGRLLQSAVNCADALEVARRCAPAWFPDCSGVIYLAQDPGNQFTAGTSWGQDVGSSKSFDSADCWAIRRGEAQFAAPSSAMACPHLKQPMAVPSLCVPVKAQGKVLGMLLLVGHSASGALDSLLPAATEFAAQIGLSLANLKMQDTLHDLSVRDALTGLFTRGYMEESLKREIATAQRKSRSLGVAICDLDHYARLNEEFGREAGDYALREIARLINTRIRSSDIACHYGDGRIALVFPEAPLDGVVMRTNQLREAISALSLEHFGRSLGNLSASYGVALFPLHGKSAGGLLRQADIALDSAKASGGNRVVVAPSAGASA